MRFLPRRAAITVAAMVALLVLASSAQAQGPHASATPPPPSAADEARADALIARGVELRVQGHDEAALGVFANAYSVAPTPRALAQLALAEQALGRWLDAYAHLETALAASGDPWITRNRTVLTTSLDAIEERLGSLDLIGAVPGAQVWSGNRRIATLPLAQPLHVLPGTLTVEVRAPGYDTLTRTIVITPGALSRETLELQRTTPGGDQHPAIVARPSGAATAAANTTRSLAPLAWAGVIASGVGALAIIIDVAAGNVLAGSYASECNTPQPTSCGPSEYSHDQSTLNAMSVAGDVFIGLAVVGVAALGVGLWQTFRSRPVSETANRPGRLRWAVGARSGMLGVSW